MIECQDCYWSNAETCRICSQEEHTVSLAAAVKEASEKGDITIYSAAKLDEKWDAILNKINGR